MNSEKEGDKEWKQIKSKFSKKENLKSNSWSSSVSSSSSDSDEEPVVWPLFDLPVQSSDSSSKLSL